MPSICEISPRQLARLIGTPSAPIILDVRVDEDFDADPTLLPGSRRLTHGEAAAHAARFAERDVVIVCQKGAKLSQGVAALLRSEGVRAEVLTGGHMAWRHEDLPLVPSAAIPAPAQDGLTVWVTRHRPKVDRIACPWLVRRFVDPGARFLFVPPADVLAVAERFDATPFDVDGVPFAHHGERCTFDAMLAAFRLETEPLRAVARIVRGADTGRQDLAPEAPGLLALSLGLSRMHRDDLSQLEAGLIFYDALYRFARDARDEVHDR